ncbi:hypothetical protein LX36DRAFT_383304 [Colletotrichum falcatum]|nr:hypothetical protein LX36DRAFT_383304 [Colletotrichum falcatum]
MAVLVVIMGKGARWRAWAGSVVLGEVESVASCWARSFLSWAASLFGAFPTSSVVLPQRARMLGHAKHDFSCRCQAMPDCIRTCMEASGSGGDVWRRRTRSSGHGADEACQTRIHGKVGSRETFSAPRALHDRGRLGWWARYAVC